MTPANIANKPAFAHQRRSTYPGLSDVMISEPGLTFRELAAIEIAAAISRGCVSESNDQWIAETAVRRADRLAAELAKAQPEES